MPGWVPVLIALVAVAFVVAVVAVVVTAVVIRSDDDDDGLDEATVDELVTRSETLLISVGDERSMAVLGLTGMEELVDPPVADNDEARRATDAALDDYAAAVADHTEAAADEDVVDAAPLDVIGDARERLATLRDDVDHHPPLVNASASLPYASGVSEMYTTILSDLLQMDRDVTVSLTDDHDVDVGFALLAEGRSLHALVIPRLTNRSIVAMTTGAMTTSQSTTDMAASIAALEGGMATVGEVASDTAYAEVADDLADELEAAGLLALTSEALETGQLDLGLMPGAANASTTALLEFEYRVRSILVRQIG